MRLTPREVEVCELLRKGLEREEIAKRLGINVKTLDSHIFNMKLKAGYDARAMWAASLLAMNAKNEVTSHG